MDRIGSLIRKALDELFSKLPHPLTVERTFRTSENYITENRQRRNCKDDRMGPESQTS